MIQRTLTKVLFIEIISLFIITSFFIITTQTAITLTIFNLLFASLIFQLKGTFIKKAVIITAGTMLGFFWNLVFYNFSLVSIPYLKSSFDVLYTLLFPFLNLCWIVPFWSLSLSCLPNNKKRFED